MKRSFGPRVRTLMALTLALITIIVGVLTVVSWPAAPATYAQDETGIVYLPAQWAPPPTPTPTPTPGPPPQFVKNVKLPYAQCPNDAEFNRVSGHMYIANIYSDNVSVFQNQEFVVDLYTGEWPRGVTSDPNSARSWITSLHGGTTLVEGTDQKGTVPPIYEPYSSAFNTANGYLYAIDLDAKIQVIDGSQLVTTIDVIDPHTDVRATWLLSIVVDPRTGLVYVSSVEHGRLYVIDGTEVIDSVLLGSGPLNMAFDDVRGLIYVAHSSPSFEHPHDISVVDVETLTVSFVDPLPGKLNKAQDVAVDVKSGLAYVTHPKLGKVTILDGTKIVRMIALGEQPWAVGVNPNNGYVFITNVESNEVSILRNGVLKDTVEVQGEEPWAVGVDTNNNDIYIANRGRKVSSDECKRASVTILH